MQSGLLGLGAYFTIQGQMSAGAIIAVSVAASRALAPIDMAIGNWKGMVTARQAYKRLRETMVALADLPEPIDLPAPSKSIRVEKITVAAPASGQILLSEVALEVKAEQGLAIIGPSGGGKTTLVRAITGIWPVLRGSVRLDNADLPQWKEDVLGQYVGYLPQEVALMDGTIVENISRFAPKRDGKGVVAAAMAAGIHEMIVRLPDGYDTQLGPQGTALSAGQRQRIGLARAFFGNPRLMVLDEPNSNLDANGERALARALLLRPARCLMRCSHMDDLEPVPPRTRGCEECLKLGTPWVHLRLCLTCGHVGCCDSSPGRHATRHFQHTNHAVIASLEPGEHWIWCYVHRAELELPAP